jgi:hypothetical protein
MILIFESMPLRTLVFISLLNINHLENLRMQWSIWGIFSNGSLNNTALALIDLTRYDSYIWAQQQPNTKAVQTWHHVICIWYGISNIIWKHFNLIHICCHCSQWMPYNYALTSSLLMALPCLSLPTQWIDIFEFMHEELQIFEQSCVFLCFLMFYLSWFCFLHQQKVKKFSLAGQEQQETNLSSKKA